jgi:hypothetical protein
MLRSTLLMLLVAGGLLVAVGPAAASQPRPAPPATAWTIYGDVIVEVVGPKDPASGGVALRLRRR